VNVTTASAAATLAVGRAIGERLDAGDVVVLSGDLGTGKTVMAKGIAAGLGVTGTVVSPTFALARGYEGRVPVHHLDVYRLDRLQEAIDLGLEELLDDGVVVVEWGEGVRELLPADRIEVTLAVVDPDPDERRITIDARGPGWSARWPELADAVQHAAVAC
jgi:tRNA threonylcarbamoyladenosine biosynthesis protein TsaE